MDWLSRAQLSFRPTDDLASLGAVCLSLRYYKGIVRFDYQRNISSDLRAIQRMVLVSYQGSSCLRFPCGIFGLKVIVYLAKFFLRDLGNDPDRGLLEQTSQIALFRLLCQGQDNRVDDQSQIMTRVPTASQAQMKVTDLSLLADCGRPWWREFLAVESLPGISG